MRVIELGSEVIDGVTNFKGIVTSRATHMNGCDRYWVQPKVGKDGKSVDGLWIDEVTLKVTRKPKKKILQSTTSRPGGFSSRVK